MTEDVTTPAGDSRNRYLFVESPGSATVMVLVYQPGSEQSVEEFARWYHQKVMQETENLGVGPVKPLTAHSGSAVPVRVVVAGATRQGVEQAFSVSAAGTVVPHRFRAFKLETTARSAFLIVQAASEDWPVVGPGFDLVLATFALDSRGGMP